MEQSYYIGNRRRLYEGMEDNSLLVLFAGHPPRQSADQMYSFFCNRNYLYATGCDEEGTALLAEKRDGVVTETLYLQRPDPMAERWSGRRLKADEAIAISGIQRIAYLDQFQRDFHLSANGGQIERVYLDLFRLTPNEPADQAHRFAQDCQRDYPALAVKNIHPQFGSLRKVKQPCEIAAMREAVRITGEAIRAMMRASRPGMWEYQYKAVFDHVLTDHGVLQPGFPPIISAGPNNFCIHYYAYTGQAQDGDLILNDVGARWQGMVNDVSRAWPCNGKFSQRQRLLYECALRTSDHMFSIIKPGMPHADVDRLAREYNYQLLHDLGLVKSYDEIGKLMWHGGAHHVGLDVHDDVTRGGLLQPGMIFCVDIGIYCEEWGIGFRLEDNCLVTEDGCENLSRAIPRTIAEIEAAMAK
ncbi:MAG: aminopeptidase P N-terminal domain-containing protein [Bacillota bacterium]